MTSDPFADLSAYTALPRLTGLALSVDGTRLVASMQQPDADRSRYVSALWEIPLGPGEPARLTRSEKGESSPAFRPDGGLLFTSARPDPDDGDDEAAVWVLPPTGEPQVLQRRAGGVSTLAVAGRSGSVLLSGSRLAGSADNDHDDAPRRTLRKDRKINAVLHTGMPIRYWDHELDETYPRLLLLEPGAAAPRVLAPDATIELVETTQSIDAEGRLVATSWRTRDPAGLTRWGIALLDTATGGRRLIDPPTGWDLSAPVLSPDARSVACALERQGRFEQSITVGLAVLDVGSGECRPVELGDLAPTEWVWSADSATLYVAGDWHGRGAVLAVDPVTGAVRSRLAVDAAYSSLMPAPDGSAIYALRSAYDCAPTPVLLDPDASEQAPRHLSTPAPMPPLPGRLVELDVPAGDVTVHSWLCLPEPADTPAPVMLWIHGGPFMSNHAWSWRWNPWVAVAQGWAVILPDPALSTGYGQDGIDRAWPYRADVVWAELEAVLDAVLERPEVDAKRVACLGGSFGGFMTNWVAGHTDRFQAIVTHAGLWALDQQHATTDNAEFKTRVLGPPAEHPEWYAAYSPHNFIDRITTPMLVSHGNRDYRVPISEALRLWWDLVSHWDGAPDRLPHRFLHFTAENHWVLSPANAEIWYDAVLGFCGEHVLGVPWAGLRTPATPATLATLG